MKFGLKRPCPLCPFRNDLRPYLRTSRAEEIADSLDAGSPFPCHETTVLEEEEGAYVPSENEHHCAGAMIVLHRESEHGSRLLFLAQRAGLYDPSELDDQAPVYDSLSEWVDAHVEENGDTL